MQTTCICRMWPLHALLVAPGESRGSMGTGNPSKWDLSHFFASKLQSINTTHGLISRPRARRAVAKTLAAELAEADNAAGQDGNGNGQRGNWEYREVTPPMMKARKRTSQISGAWLQKSCVPWRAGERCAASAPPPPKADSKALENAEKSRAGYRGGTPGGSELSSLSSDSEEDEAEVAGTMVLVGKGDLDETACGKPG
ncbi:hypothetical protein B0H14DRAFT_3143413 [Mycena olivaceomarginata]|nr:hypothetical protein B0H14DRAFT_3143413 [Mycena olivaceomarginata]